MSQSPDRPPVCVVIGVGPGNGAAFVRRFESDGYAVAMFARSEKTTEPLAQELERTKSYRVDVAEPAEMTAALARVTEDLGPPDVLIYNAGKAVWGAALEVSEADFESAWRVNTYGALIAARNVIPSMIERGRGRIIFIGATASRRGGAKSAAFAAAKAAQRSLAQSLARAYGPAGIHVSLVIVDGAVDEPHSRQRLTDKSDDFFIEPGDLADVVFALTQQKPSAWTFELDVRPYGETW